MSAKCSRVTGLVTASRPGRSSHVLAACLAGLLTACTEDAGRGPADPEGSGYRPLLVLSERVGDVGGEAVHIGLPEVHPRASLDRDLLDASGDGILYVDVDSVEATDLRDVLDLVHAGLAEGRAAVIETSEFDFDKMHGIVAAEFPAIDRATIEDVAVLLHQDAGTGVVTAARIDPSELAMLGGVEFEDTTAGRARALAEELARTAPPPNLPAGALLDTIAPGATSALGAGYYDPINFAIRAYDASPGQQGNWQLRHNGTYVDVWKTGSGASTACYVAWRGTDTSNFWDVWADGSSQFASAIRVDNVEGNTTLKGGRGFVNRLHSQDDTVKNRLTSLGCKLVMITGHSLGGAVSQLHGSQLAFDPTWKSRLLAVDAWNSPNVVNTATRAVVVARFNNLGNLWSVNCRRNDLIVNSVPTGLVRLGPASSQYVGGCTHVSPQVSSIGTSNHSMDYWLDELD